MNMADPNLGYTYKAQLSQNIANPFYNYLTPDVFPGALRNQATVTQGQPAAAISAIRWRSDAEQLSATGGRVTRRCSCACSAPMRPARACLFAYNYNQERNEAYFNDPQQYVNQVFWLGSNNARHRATIAGTYDFPIGKGRKFGSIMHPILNAAFGGWQMSGIYTYRSGEFLRFDGQMDYSGATVYRQSRSAEVVQHGCISGAAAVHSATNPYQYRRHHGTDLLERWTGTSRRRSRSGNGTSWSSGLKLTT